MSSFASPYIKTVTVAVARNADLLTYTGADVALLKTLACTFSREVGVSNIGVTCAIAGASASDAVQSFVNGTTPFIFQGLVGGVTQWMQNASNAYTPGTKSKAAQSFAANSIFMDKDGTAQTQDVSASVPTVDRLHVGHVAGSYVFNGPVNHIYGWTRNLSQSELGAVDR